jgi:hypothetical protein
MMMMMIMIIIIMIIIIMIMARPECEETVLWNQQVQTDRTIPDSKPDIILFGKEKGTCMLILVAMSGDRNAIKKEAEKILIYEDPYDINTTHVGCKIRIDAGNNRGNWTHLTIIKKIREQHTGKA